MITNKHIEQILIPKIQKARRDGLNLYIRTCDGVKFPIQYCTVKDGIGINVTPSHRVKVDSKFLYEEGNITTIDGALSFFKVDLTLKDLP